MTDERASLNPRPMVAELPSNPGGTAVPAAAPAPAAVATALPEPDLVGQVLDGRYQIVRRLGEGTLCVVYEARHSGSGRHFAIKVLRASFAAKPQALDSFLHQTRVAAQVRHSNVIAIEEFGYTPSRSVYAAVELAVGQPLQAILKTVGKWSWAQVRPVAVQIAAALRAAHEAGVLHRALKPSNCFLFLDPRGKREPLVKVADFGMAQVGVDASQAAPGATSTTLFGDPEFMAPEQGMSGQVSPQSDIYSLGVVLYQMLTGRVPFSNPNAFQVISQHGQKDVPSMREIEPTVPEVVERIVLRCLAKAPEQRFGSAAEVEQAFAAIDPAVVGGGVSSAGAPAAAPAAGNPRFARMITGGSGGSPAPSATPPKQASVIVAGTIGEGPPAASGMMNAPPAPPSVPSHAPSSPSGSSSFLASRPGLRMGLGAGVGDAGGGPAPPATVAPGMAMVSPTIAPSGLGGLGGPLPSLTSTPPPSLGGSVGIGIRPPDPGEASGAGGMPPLGPESMPGGGPGGGLGYPASAGPGMPPAASGPSPMPGAGGGAGPGYSRAVGAGMPPPGPSAMPGADGGGGAGPGYSRAVGAGMPSPDPNAMSGAGGGAMGGPGYSQGVGPGMPPPGPTPGPMPGVGGGSPGPGYSRGVGAGMPLAGAGAGAGVGPGMPPIGIGPGMPPIADPGSGDGLMRGVGPGMPAREGIGTPSAAGMGMGMPRGVGRGMPPPNDPSGPNPVVSASIPRVEPPALSESVEYDEDDQPKRRPLMILGIGVAVIGLGLGLGWIMIGGLDEPEGDVSKVTRAQKAQDVYVDPDDPEPDSDPEADDPVFEPKPKPKTKPKKELTFEQVLAGMKGRIRKKCAKLGPGPVQIDTLVVKGGGSALTPKIKPKNPVGDCALRIVERTKFPASERDHNVKETVGW